MLALACDRSSTSTGRWVDVDGRMRVPESTISRAEVSDYMGREIPSWEMLGLDAGRIYPMLRAPDELAAAADGFHGVPLVSRHVPVSAQAPQNDLVIGCVMNPVFRDPDLLAELIVWDADAIRRIERMDERGPGAGLSCGYRFTADMRAGSHGGQRYAGIMRNLVANHVALVDSPRVRNAVVGDAAPSLTPLELAARYAPGITRVAIGPVYF
jgi:hypothetical protein